MHSTERLPSVAMHCRSLVCEAVEERGVPLDVAAAAERATRARFTARPEERPVAPSRVSAYFWGVVRRRLGRLRKPCDATSRLVLAAVVADLADCGRPAEDIWDELQRGWGDKVPQHVLEEYHGSLCA